MMGSEAAPRHLPRLLQPMPDIRRQSDLDGDSADEVSELRQSHGLLKASTTTCRASESRLMKTGFVLWNGS